MAVRISRRRMLAGVTGVAGAAAVGYAGLSAYDEADLIRTSLRRSVGEFRMADSDLHAFIESFKAGWKGLGGYKSTVMRAAELSGLASLARAAGPEMLSDRIERYERELVTSFLMQTDYLRVADPTVDQISFVGAAAACASPFARFEFD